MKNPIFETLTKAQKALALAAFGAAKSDQEFYKMLLESTEESTLPLLDLGALLSELYDIVAEMTGEQLLSTIEELLI